MTYESLFDDMEKPRKKRRKKIKRPKTLGLLWHVYHTVLAVELGLILIIEFIELMRGI
jgi:hypothetical protein|tara:strand:+ start:839 stop:1012 length:174 start_codon:yes stop_codon:yes gene_type:complete